MALFALSCLDCDSSMLIRGTPRRTLTSSSKHLPWHPRGDSLARPVLSRKVEYIGPAC
jgi:hypothetical protein